MRVAISCSTMLGRGQVEPCGLHHSPVGQGDPLPGSGPLRSRQAPGRWRAFHQRRTRALAGQAGSLSLSELQPQHWTCRRHEPEGRSWGGRGGSSGWASIMAKGYGGHGTFQMVDGHNKHDSALCLMGCLTGLPNSLQSSAGCPPHRRGS